MERTSGNLSEQQEIYQKESYQEENVYTCMTKEPVMFQFGKKSMTPGKSPCRGMFKSICKMKMKKKTSEEKIQE